MSDSEVVSLVVENGEARITINREKSLNALNLEVLENLSTKLEGVSNLSFGDCRVLTIRAAGDRAFVAGADIKLMKDASRVELLNFISLGQSVMRQIELLSVPVIAVVGGFAIGGGLELALACDLIVASQNAKMGQAEVTLGLIPGFGGSERLALRVGTGVAKRLIFTAETISASEAYRVGLVDWLVETQDLEEKVASIVDLLQQKGPLALRAAKRSVERATETQKLAGLTKEVEEFLELFRYKDTQEGLSAFIEKRKPNFEGS